MFPDIIDLALFFGYVFYEIVYYLIYGDKVHYPVYKIDDKHIILGSCHSNYIDSVDINILNEIYACNIVCIEVLNSIPEKTVKTLLENINSSNEDKVVNIINSFEGEIENSKKIKNYYYTKSFLDKIKHRFVDGDVDIKYVLTLHIKIIRDLYGMDSIIQYQSLSKGKKVIALDEEKKAKEIRNNLYTPVKITETYGITLINIVENFNFIKSYLLSFPNFITLYNEKCSDLMLKAGLITTGIIKTDILDGRNEAWMKKIEDTFTTDKTAIIVGAAHISGLIKILKKNHKIEKYNYWQNNFTTIK